MRLANVRPAVSGKSRRRWLKLAVSAAALGLVISRLDTARLWAELRHVEQWTFAVAFLLYLAGQVITALRWGLIARAAGFGESKAKVCLYYYVGMFFNLFGPSTLGGDLVRSLYLGGATNRRTAALHTVVFDRVIGFVMLVVVALGAMLAFGRMGIPRGLAAITGLAGVAALCGWLSVPGLARLCLRPGHPLREVLEVELASLWEDRRLLLEVALISVGFHMLQIGAVALLGRGLGLPVDWRYYFLCHPLVTILSAIPVSLAGLGIREMGYVYFLSALQGVAREGAVALALLWLGVVVGASLVGGAVFLASGAELPPVRAPGSSLVRENRDRV